jgi:hypothetical protein
MSSGTSASGWNSFLSGSSLISYDVPSVSDSDEDIPLVAPTVSQQPLLMQTVCNRQSKLQESIRTHFGKVVSVVDKHDGPFHRITVRWSAVLSDALRHMCIANNVAMLRPLRVTFIGEAAVDKGGPRREFATLLAHAVHRCNLVDGIAGRNTLCHDVEHLTKHTFEQLGRLFALTVLQGGSGPLCFSRPAAYYILYGEVDSGEIDDVPHYEVYNSLKQD